MKHVSDRELSSSVPNDLIASQHGTVSTDNDACQIELVDDSIGENEIITNEIDKTASHANTIEFKCAKDVESREAENETQISSNSIRVEIESPPLDDNYNRSESPPSLELTTGQSSDNECDINEVNDEFDEFQRNSNELSVDTTSLPSLNFDSIRNSPDFKSDEIDDKKSEPDDVDVATAQPIYADENVTLTSSELFDGEPPPLPPLDVTPESVCSTSFHPIEIAELNPAVDDDEVPSEQFAFDADFSQIAAFESENESQQQQQEFVESMEQQPYVESKPIDDDFDDDFGDFEGGPNESKTTGVENTSQDAAVDFDDDDDFGDFNDFQQDTVSVPAPVHASSAEIPKSTSFDLKSISERFKSILDTVFPTNIDDDEDTSSTRSSDMITTKKIDHFINGTTMQLKNFENAKALQHQWTNSTGKSVLIKALGVDARNIVSHEYIR